MYPEYTGTVAEVLMKSSGRPSMEEMRAYLRPQGIGMSDSLGFNDGYALAVTRPTQQKYGLYKISDLARHPELRLAFTHEFIGRKDGYAGLSQHYGLAMNNVSTILAGAIPAAIMALVIHGAFEALDRLVIPRALRRRGA